MKSICIILILALEPILVVAQFQNPFASKNGYAALSCEATNGNILTLTCADSMATLSKLTYHGQMMASASVPLLSKVLQYDWLSERNDTIILAYTIVTANDKIHKQVFTFFDSQLKVLFTRSHHIDSLPRLSHAIWYTSSQQFLWSGYIHPLNRKATYDIIRFDAMGNLIQRLSVDTFIQHGTFSRLFNVNDTLHMYVTLSGYLYRYRFTKYLARISKDSFQIAKAPFDTSKLTQCNDIIDILPLENGVFLASTTCNNFMNKIIGGVYTINGIQMISTHFAKIQDTVLSHSSFGISAGWHHITYSNGVFYSVGRYSAKNDLQYFTMVHAFNKDGSFKKMYTIWDTAIVNSELMQIQALKDGGCLVIGYQNNMIYVAKLDTSGTVSFITPVSTNSNKLVLYPNPGKDKIYGLTNASRLEVTDINGRVYAYEVINETSDLSNLSAGVYFIIAYSTNNEIRYKGKWVKE